MDDTTPKTYYRVSCMLLYVLEVMGLWTIPITYFLGLPHVVMSFRSYESIDYTTSITYYLVCYTYFTKLIIFNQ